MTNSDPDLAFRLLDSAVDSLLDKVEAEEDGRDEDAEFHERQYDQAMEGLEALDDEEVAS